MTKKDLEKRIENLERRNKFLLLRIKLIKEALSNAAGMKREEIFERIGYVDYYTSPENIKDDIKHLEEYDFEYNHHEESMDISEYED